MATNKKLSAKRLKELIGVYTQAKTVLAGVESEFKPISKAADAAVIELKAHVLATQDAIKTENFSIVPVAERKEHKIKDVAALVAKLAEFGVDPDDYIVEKMVDATTRLSNNF